MYSVGQVRTAARRVAKRAVRPREAKVAREAAFLAAGKVTPVIALDSHGARFFLDTRDMGQARLVFMHGNRDVGDLRSALSLLAEAGIGDGTLGGSDFADIGANIGTTSIPAALTFGARRVIAFEPSPANFALLRMAVVANGVDDQVVAHQIALTDAPGTVRLALSDFNSGDHRVTRDSGDGTRDTIEVEAATFDGLIAAGEVDPERLRLAWIDVQGHEAQVLAGAQTLLEARVPLHIEFWPTGLTESGGLDRLCELLATHYRSAVDMRTLEPEGTPPVRHDTRALPDIARTLPGERYTNLLLLP